MSKIIQQSQAISVTATTRTTYTLQANMKLKKCAKQLIQTKSRFLRGTGEVKHVNMVTKRYLVYRQIKSKDEPNIVSMRKS